MQWKSGRSWSLFCTLAAAFLPGCQPPPAPVGTPAAPHQGIELRIACPNAATAALLLGRGQTWALRQGAKIAVSRYDPAADLPSVGPADVWIISPAELPHWAAAGRLAALPEAYTARENPYVWMDLLPTYREQLVLWERTPYGMPLVGESPLCCYRADLFKGQAVQSAFAKQFGRKLDAPATWEQYAWLAEYFRAHMPSSSSLGSAEKAGDRSAPTLPPLPRDDADLDRLFYTVAAGHARRAVPADEARRAGHQDQDDVFSFHYDLKTGRPRIAAPGFVQALKLLQRLQKCRPGGSVDHPEEAFRDGRAVLCLTDAPWLKAFQKMPALRDKVGLCRVPGGDSYFDYDRGFPHPTPGGNRVPYLGGAGWLAVVPRAGEHTAAAFDLLADLSGPKTSTQIFLGEVGAGGPLRIDQLDSQRWDAFDLDQAQALKLPEVLRETLMYRGLKNPVVCLRTPRQAAHRAVLVKELRDALLRGTDAEKALNNVAEAWDKLDREQGQEAHQADYRRSLGLLAK
jgi:multiple sugar transport system substrate-binding protein